MKSDLSSFWKLSSEVTKFPPALASGESGEELCTNSSFQKSLCRTFHLFSWEVTQKPITGLRYKLQKFAIWLLDCSNSPWNSENYLWLTA